MTTPDDPSNRAVEAKYVEDHAVVRLMDGRVGRFVKEKRGRLVIFADKSATTVPATEPLVVVEWPAQLAATYVSNFEHHAR